MLVFPSIMYNVLVDLLKIIFIISYIFLEDPLDIIGHMFVFNIKCNVSWKRIEHELRKLFIVDLWKCLRWELFTAFTSLHWLTLVTYFFMWLQPLFQAGNGTVFDRTPECWKDFPCKCCCSKWMTSRLSIVFQIFWFTLLGYCWCILNWFSGLVLRLVGIVKTWFLRWVIFFICTYLLYFNQQRMSFNRTLFPKYLLMSSCCILWG